LVNGKHRYSPPDQAIKKNGRSIPLLNGLTIAAQKLIGKSRSGNREQRKNRNNRKCFHAKSSIPIVAKSVSVRRIFRTFR